MKVGIIGLRIGSLVGDPERTLLGNPQRSWALYSGLRAYGFETELYVDPGATVAINDPGLENGLIRNQEDFIERIKSLYDYTIICGTRIHTTFDNHPWLQDVDGGKLILAQCYHNVPKALPDAFRSRIVAALFVSPRYIRSWVEEYPGIYTSMLTTGSPSHSGDPGAPHGDVVFVGHIHNQRGLKLIVDIAKCTPDSRFVVISSRIRRPGGKPGDYVAMGLEPEDRREDRFKQILQEYELEYPENLRYLHLPPGEEDGIMEHASVGLDVAWSKQWLIDNSKVNYYLGYGIPVITQPPSLSYRFVEMAGSGEVLPYNATPQNWGDAVRRWRGWTLDQKRALRELSAQRFDWKNAVFDVYNAILQDNCGTEKAKHKVLSRHQSLY